MVNQQPDLFSHYFHRIDAVHRAWSWFFTLGLILIILGVLSIGYSTTATLVSVGVLGILLVLAGITQIVHSFWSVKWSGFFLSLLLGVLYTVVGVISLINPALSAISLTLLIGTLCLVGGLFRLIAAPIAHFDHWGWVFVNGIVTFILGLLILADWPISGLWVIGLFVGIDMIFIGWSWVLLALAARSYGKKISSDR